MELTRGGGFNGQLDLPAAVHSGKEPPVPIRYEAGWSAAGLDVSEREKYVLLP